MFISDSDHRCPLQTDPTSQKIVASMQPHLDAFVGVRTKKKHTLEMVNKMMATLPKTTVKVENRLV